MTMLHTITRDLPMGVGVADAPIALSKIHEPGCAAAIWQRHPLQAFQSWLDALDPNHLPSARLILRADAIHDAMLHLCRLSGTPQCSERALLVDDIAALADIFANVMGAEYLRLRLDVVQANACRKFHVDAVTARLICTYRGTGTQYGMSPDGADPDAVYTVPTCAPIVLRGSLWPTHPPSGLRHRSPPIESTGETRLVLVLDPVADQEDTPQMQPMTRH